MHSQEYETKIELCGKDYAALISFEWDENYALIDAVEISHSVNVAYNDRGEYAPHVEIRLSTSPRCSMVFRLPHFQMRFVLTRFIGSKKRRPRRGLCAKKTAFLKRLRRLKMKINIDGKTYCYEFWLYEPHAHILGRG